MQLADFILTNREPILVEWEAFARTCSPASGPMNVVALRDHADQMLTAIAADLQTPQGDREQAEKSKGHSDADAGDAGEPETAAEAHGSGRAESGFTIEQMVAEYRALRASVIRLWTAAKGPLDPADVEDLTRFNEAIDQALAESVARYNDDLEQAKEMFMAILGHDLRTPLGAISTSAKFMLDLEELKEPHLTLTQRIVLSAERATKMVGDLLDFTRGRLGGGIPVERTETYLGRIVHDAVEEMRAAHPGAHIEVEARGVQQGEWDEARLSQVLSNLVGNAVQHGSEDTPVRVSIMGEDNEVTLQVHNSGAAISPDDMDGIFNPMKTGSSPGRVTGSGSPGGLGLGLFIAQEIVTAHNGRIEVESSRDTGTTFTVILPRWAESAATPDQA